MRTKWGRPVSSERSIRGVARSGPDVKGPDVISSKVAVENSRTTQHCSSFSGGGEV